LRVKVRPVLPKEKPIPPSAFSPIQTFTTLSAKIGYLSQEGAFELYPNPTSGLLQLRFYSPQSQILHLKLADLLGNAPWGFTFQALPGENEQSITLPPQLSAGVYLLLLQKEGQERYIQRFKVNLIR
jgi:hypothetical protein